MISHLTFVLMMPNVFTMRTIENTEPISITQIRKPRLMYVQDMYSSASASTIQSVLRPEPSATAVSTETDECIF